jgi:hypothetical protein
MGNGIRIGANLMNGRVAIGGHLYIGQRAMYFIPHKKNLKMHQAPVERCFEAVPTVQIIERKRTIFHRMLYPDPVRLLRIGNGEHDAIALLTADPDEARKAVLAFFGANAENCES